MMWPTTGDGPAGVERTKSARYWLGKIGAFVATEQRRLEREQRREHRPPPREHGEAHDFCAPSRIRRRLSRRRSG
ncbi:hypothetical protein ABZ342_34665 [Amycolatopsis sp. NPDC005961]|uniref:hypothetical protein n=1 Tax=Amycolatopsis sp. NPDC005961 TaxID=3156720 RepID=UPI0034000D97